MRWWGAQFDKAVLPIRAAVLRCTMHDLAEHTQLAVHMTCSSAGRLQQHWHRMQGLNHKRHIAPSQSQPCSRPCTLAVIAFSC